MAIHCHSARYHYDSFHNRGGDIINIGSNNTYNFGSCGFGSSIWCNGGNFWGGFGTSLGWGLGQGLMNWLGNGLNGGGWNPAGIFGGYGMGYGMSYGMNPWQQMSTFSWGGSTGGGGNSSSSIAKKNTDYAKLNKLFDRKNALLAKDNPSLDDLKTLKNDIDAAAKNLDGNDDGNDNDYIKALRFGLDDKIKKLEGNQTSTAQSTTPTTTSTTTPSSTTPTTPAGPADTTSNQAGGTSTTAASTNNAGNVNTSNLTSETIKKLTPEQISKITSDEAKSLLKILGALNKNNDGVNATTNYVTLLLAQKSGLPLSCGHNTSLDNIKGADAYIKGKISDVKLEKNIITFSLETNNTKIQIKCEADSTKYTINKTIKNITNEYEDATVGTEYEIKQGLEYGIRIGTAAMRRKKA